MKHSRGLVVVAVATVVATSGPIPKVAARLEAAGSGAATARGGLLVGRGSQHWDGAGRPWRLSRL
jgi:hypothetical protein